MPWQFGRFIRRPFQSLFYSMDYHYNESKELYKRIHAQDPAKPQDFDQDLWMREKTASRACFIMGIAGLEAFVNNVLRDFSVRGKEDIAENLLNKSQKNRRIEYWRLTDKVYFLPTLCNSQIAPPAVYFKRESKEFQLFEELVEIRNRIMHGRPDPYLVLIKLKTDKMSEVNDSLSDNFWPISKIHKDFTAFNYQCAKTAYNNITWARDSLVSFLEKVDEKYMGTEKIELISPIIPDGKVGENELLTSWQDYVKK